MIKFQKIVFNVKSESETFDLGYRVVSLRGTTGMGKSSFISLFYVLLGSESTLKEKPSFEIWNDEKFDIPFGSSFELFLESENGVFVHKVEKTQNGLKFFINDKEVKQKDLKENYKSLSGEFQLNDYSRDSVTKFSKYNVDSFFRAFQKLNDKIFSPSSKTKLLNDKIVQYLMGDDPNFYKLFEKREEFYILLEKSKKEKYKTELIDFEIKKLESERNALLSQNLMDSSENTSSDLQSLIQKQNKLNNRRVYIESILAAYSEQKSDASTFSKYLNLIDKINFSNKELEENFRRILKSKIIENYKIRSSEFDLQKRVQDIDKELNTLKEKIVAHKFSKNSKDRLSYFDIRIEYLVEAKSDINFNQTDHENILKNIEEINAKLSGFDIKKSFISKANELLSTWSVEKANYIDVDNSFKLIREKNTSTSVDLVDKVIAFAITIEHAIKNLEDKEMMPSLVSANMLNMDMEDRDVASFKPTMDKFSKKLLELSKKNVLILIQDKKCQITGDDVMIIDFNEKNPFNKKKEYLIEEEKQ